MPVYDYNQLQIDVCAAGKRPDYAGAKVQRFIAEGEVRIREALRAYLLTAVLDDTKRASTLTNEYSLPTRTTKIRHIIPLSAAGQPALDQVDETQAAAYLNSSLTTMYCARPSTVLISGIPGTGVTFTLNYFGLPDNLSVTSSNALLTEHQLIYLNAALVSLHRETKEPDFMSAAQQEMAGMIEQLNRRMKKLLAGGRATAPYNTSWQSSY